MTGASTPLLMIIDDSATNARMLEELLESAAFRVIWAQTGEIAIETVQTVTPDLILLDITMPGMDGFETCRYLKAIEATQDVPIIFMTALSHSLDKVRGLSLGAVDYITKPFQQEEVLARVNVHLKLYQLTQGLEQRVEARAQELTAALAQLQQSQLQMMHSEKLSSLGQMVAGIAHEINNPAGFVKGNVKYAKIHITALLEHVHLCHQLIASAENPMGWEKLTQHAEMIDLEYVLGDLPKLIHSMQTGIDRICEISVSLRNFSRSDQTTKVPFNLHAGLDSTLMILKHRLKANKDRPEIQVIKEYNELPDIECFPGQINQVFMNILANAIDALDESSRDKSYTELEQNPNTITIQTIATDHFIRVSIVDNGPGIPEDIQKQLFLPFFTTKAVGEGTGLGLSISHQIVTNKHGGLLTCLSRRGCGTEFVIELPLKPTLLAVHGLDPAQEHEQATQENGDRHPS